MTRTLNEITQYIATFHAALDEAEGDIGKAAELMGKTPEEFEKEYMALAFEDASKKDAYIHVIEQRKAKRAASQAMVDQWEERIKSHRADVKAEDRTIEFMTRCLKTSMEANGETKFVTPDGRKVWLHGNSSTPLLIDEEKFNALTRDEQCLLETMGILVLQPMLSKDALKRHLENGDSISFAKLGERGTHVRFK